MSTYKSFLLEEPHLKCQAGGTLVRNIFIVCVRASICVYRCEWTCLELACGVLSGTMEQGMGENTCKVYVRYVFVALVAMQTF